jgi:L-threonylcarbamoyladenylate synthase
MAPVFSNFKHKQFKEIICNGGVGVLPTDTLYGLVCRASDRLAVERMYGLKNRDKKPGTLIAADIDQLVTLGLKKRYLTSASQFWPGPVSVIVPTDNHNLDYLDQGIGTLAVRVVSDKKVAELLRLTGPLITSSANRPGEEPAHVIPDAQDYFGNSIDFYVDGGNFSNRKPSTLIRVLDDEIDILRHGAGSILNNKERGNKL